MVLLQPMQQALKLILNRKFLRRACRYCCAHSEGTVISHVSDLTDQARNLLCVTVENLKHRSLSIRKEDQNQTYLSFRSNVVYTSIIPVPCPRSATTQATESHLYGLVWPRVLGSIRAPRRKVSRLRFVVHIISQCVQNRPYDFAVF